MDKDYRSRNYLVSHFYSSRRVVDSLKLYEVIPVQDHGRILQVFNYKRIKAEELDKEMIERIYALQNAKAINVLETEEFFLIQYPERPIIYLRKSNGRLYALGERGYTQKEVETQASFVIRMLHKFGKVEDLHSKRIGGRKKRKEEQLPLYLSQNEKR